MNNEWAGKNWHKPTHPHSRAPRPEDPAGSFKRESAEFGWSLPQERREERPEVLRKGELASPPSRLRAPGAGRGGAGNNRCRSGPTFPAAGARAGPPERAPTHARAPLLVGVWEAGRSGRGRARLVVAPPPPALPTPVPCGPGSHFGKSFVMVVG